MRRNARKRGEELSSLDMVCVALVRLAPCPLGINSAEDFALPAR
jgi:hypothetical protein